MKIEFASPAAKALREIDKKIDHLWGCSSLQPDIEEYVRTARDYEVAQKETAKANAKEAKLKARLGNIEKDISDELLDESIKVFVMERVRKCAEDETLIVE